MILLLSPFVLCGKSIRCRHNVLYAKDLCEDFINLSFHVAWKKKVIQVWNDLRRMNKVNYPF